jgi:hypothetical protein
MARTKQTARRSGCKTGIITEAKRIPAATIFAAGAKKKAATAKRLPTGKKNGRPGKSGRPGAFQSARMQAEEIEHDAHERAYRSQLQHNFAEVEFDDCPTIHQTDMSHLVDDDGAYESHTQSKRIEASGTALLAPDAASDTYGPVSFSIEFSREWTHAGGTSEATGEGSLHFESVEGKPRLRMSACLGRGTHSEWTVDECYTECGGTLGTALEEELSAVAVEFFEAASEDYSPLKVYEDEESEDEESEDEDEDGDEADESNAEEEGDGDGDAGSMEEQAQALGELQAAVDDQDPDAIEAASTRLVAVLRMRTGVE